jgi:hypothetical protein
MTRSRIETVAVIIIIIVLMFGCVRAYDLSLWMR